jgi:hypothetical protein
MSDLHPEAPPAGEEIHLPGPSAIPLLSALGITLIVIGTTIWWVLSVVGILIFLGTTYRWVTDTRKDVVELPEEHHH